MNDSEKRVVLAKVSEVYESVGYFRDLKMPMLYTELCSNFKERSLNKSEKLVIKSEFA